LYAIGTLCPEIGYDMRNVISCTWYGTVCFWEEGGYLALYTELGRIEKLAT
jgi:hypothetical protein